MSASCQSLCGIQWQKASEEPAISRGSLTPAAGVHGTINPLPIRRSPRWDLLGCKSSRLDFIYLQGPQYQLRERVGWNCPSRRSTQAPTRRGDLGIDPVIAISFGACSFDLLVAFHAFHVRQCCNRGEETVQVLEYSISVNLGIFHQSFQCAHLHRRESQDPKGGSCGAKDSRVRNKCLEPVPLLLGFYSRELHDC
jgi:hypothetical protein